MKTVKIGILKPGSAPEKLAAEKGDYDALFRALLQDDGLEFVTYDIENGILPESAVAADAWIITGSRHGVYENHRWIAPLEKLIREIQTAKRPLVGICFGHQIVAQALGGRVERADSGWIAGPQSYRDDSGYEFIANAWHRDQVVSPPADATVIATSVNCPFAGFRYPGPILTLQPHPEFSPEYLVGLFKERGDVLPETLRNHIESNIFTSEPDITYLGKLLSTILRS